MTISTFDVVLVTLLVLLAPLAILFTAPSFASGMYRLRFIFHTLGLVLLIAPVVGGIALLVWGFASGSKELVYLAILPFIFAVMARDLVLRGYRSFFGLGPGPFRKFWNETLEVWGVGRQKSKPQRQAQPSAGARQSGATTFSFSADIGHTGARVLAPLFKFALDRMTADAISVLPLALHLDLTLPGTERERSDLDSFRRDLAVRRRDGGAMALSVDSDLAFLRFAVSPQLPDGSYLVAVGLLSERIARGRFAGTISIHTDDPAVPFLSVPVDATVA